MLVQLTIAVLLMAGLGIGLSAFLALADKKLRVDEDPRIDQVEELLPHANCGACGQAGCRAFAERAVKGKVNPNQCTVNSAENTEAIASLLGVKLTAREKRVARLSCAGGNHVARFRAHYSGIPSCRAAHMVGGGGKGCAWGCLGMGDCRTSCQFGAITLNAFNLPVVDLALCTACGACVRACPRELFSIHPISHQLWVACRSRTRGKQAEAECEVTCTGCGRCVKDAPEGLMRLDNALAAIDYDKNDLASQAIIQRCPTGAIVWYEEPDTPVKGMAAKRVARETSLPIG